MIITDGHGRTIVDESANSTPLVHNSLTANLHSLGISDLGSRGLQLDELIQEPDART